MSESECSVAPAGAGSALLAGPAPRLESGLHAGVIRAPGSAAKLHQFAGPRCAAKKGLTTETTETTEFTEKTGNSKKMLIWRERTQ